MVLSFLFVAGLTLVGASTKEIGDTLDEFKAIDKKKMADLLAKTINKSLKAVDADIKTLERKLMELMKKDESSGHLFEIVISSLNCVCNKFVTSRNLITDTKQFTVITTVESQLPFVV